MKLRTFRPQLETLDERCLPSLTPGGIYPVNTSPLGIVTSDFNNDGQLDLATANGNLTITVLPGAGNGTFGNKITSPGWVQSPVVGDFDGDGNDDLAAVFTQTYVIGDPDGPYFSYEGCYSWVDVCRGNGDGSFQSARTVYETDTGWFTLRVADVNGDGRSDLGLYTPYLEYYITLLGNPDGSFLQTTGDPADFPQPPNPDLNGDGYGDAVRTAATGVAIRLGRSDGNFGPEQVFPTGSYSTAVVTGDFNSDGHLDVAAANGNLTVSVLLNDGNWLPADAPTIQINNAAVTEGNTGTRSANFTVTLSATSTQTITVPYATGNDTAAAGSDFTSTSGTLTFAPGETSKTISVVVKGDRLAEPNENFLVNLSSPTSAIIADGQGQGTILDDEPRISIGDVSKREGRNNTTLFIFTVTLSVAYDQAVTMSFQTVNGSATTGDNDYVAKAGTLTFNPGETTKTITIEVKGDSKKEFDESFYLDLFGNSSNSLFTRNRGIGTILNDD